jgi:hypothetical protein
VAGKGGRDEDDGAWYERPFEAELEDDWGNVENEVEFVTALIDRGKEPRGDALHLIQRLLDVLLQHEVQHQP